MNVLAQALTGAALAIAAVTAAVTHSKGDTLPPAVSDPAQTIYVVRIDVKGAHDAGALLWKGQTFTSMEACQKFLENPSDEFISDLFGLVQMESVSHADDPTFDIEKPTCVGRPLQKLAPKVERS